MDVNIAALIRELDDFRTRARAKRALAAAGAEAVDAVVEALGSPSEGAAWAAAAVLGEIGDRRAVPALVGRLDDPRLGPAASEALAKITRHRGPTSRTGWEKYLAESGFTTGKPAFDLARLLRTVAEELKVAVAARGKHFEVTVRLQDGREQRVTVLGGVTSPEGESLVVAYTDCGPASAERYEWALKKNLTVPHGALALREVDGRRNFVMVDTHVAESLDAHTLGRTIASLARHGDAIEKLLTSGGDLR